MPKTAKKKKASAVSKSAKKKSKVSLKVKAAKRHDKKVVKASKPAKVSKSSAAIRSAKATVTSKPAKPEKRIISDDRFNAKDLREIREKLVGVLEDLQNEIKHEVNSASERDLAQLMDTSDIASDAAEGELSIRIAESEGVEAAEVQKAIDKIDNGSYGLCERCNKPIGTERIKFKPFASMCIKCQEIVEIRRRESGDEDLDEFAAPSEEVLEES
jgi:DnaK suppressor protein